MVKRKKTPSPNMLVVDLLSDLFIYYYLQVTFTLYGSKVA